MLTREKRKQRAAFGSRPVLHMGKAQVKRMSSVRPHRAAGVRTVKHRHVHEMDARSMRCYCGMTAENLWDQRRNGVPNWRVPKPLSEAVVRRLHLAAVRRHGGPLPEGAAY